MRKGGSCPPAHELRNEIVEELITSMSHSVWRRIDSSEGARRRI